MIINQKILDAFYGFSIAVIIIIGCYAIYKTIWCLIKVRQFNARKPR